jgi:hypothetical protein
MAANSRREQILLKLIDELTALRTIKFVERKDFQGLKDLQGYAETQLPIAVIMGRLPSPEYKISGRDGHTVDKVHSTLGVDVLVYAHDNVNPDSTISDLADDVWAAILDDETHGFKWVTGTQIIPEVNIGVWDPYCAFSMLVNITYIHGKGGI